MSRLSAREEFVRDRVRDQRERALLSQEEMGERLGLTKAGYGHYERGRQPFSLDMLFRVAAVLHLPVEKLLGLESELAPDELECLSDYRRLTPFSRETARDVVRTLAENEAKYRTEG